MVTFIICPTHTHKIRTFLFSCSLWVQRALYYQMWKTKINLRETSHMASVVRGTVSTQRHPCDLTRRVLNQAGQGNRRVLRQTWKILLGWSWTTVANGLNGKGKHGCTQRHTVNQSHHFCAHLPSLIWSDLVQNPVRVRRKLKSGTSYCQTWQLSSNLGIKEIKCASGFYKLAGVRLCTRFRHLPPQGC